MDIYTENIIDHYKHPQNFGVMHNYDRKQEEINRSCGDQITLYLKLEQDKIQDILFRGRGCAISMASASLLSEEVKGKTIAEAKKLSKDLVLELLAVDLQPVRLKCALLVWQALQNAIR